MLVDGGVGLGVAGPFGFAEAGEKQVATAWLAARGRQPVPGGEQLRVGFGQGPLLVAKYVQDQAGVEFRVVDLPALQPTVLVVLDQVVVGVARKGQGTELQGVDRRKVQQAQVGLGRLEVGQVESD